MAGKKTLVVDGDLRNPDLTRLLGMRGLGGLTNILRSGETLETAAARYVRPSGIAGLDVLPCGPRPSNPSELLSSVHFEEVVAWAESVYDQVLFDCPPTLAASDAAIISRHLDGVVVVIQPEKNRRRQVFRAFDGLSSVGVNLLGVVANRISRTEDAYGYGYGYGYGQEHDQEEEDLDEAPERDSADDAIAVRIVPIRQADPQAPSIRPRRVA
jgi:capsular exopolysaccharide synthesis family protein